MKSITPKLLSILLFTVFLFSCSQEDDGIYFNESSETINTTVTYSEIETEILTLVNEYRESKGLSSLITLNIISGVADGHTNYMITTGQVNHDNFNLRAQNLIDNAAAKSVSENVAYGYSTAQGVVNGWLNSDEHRKAIEDPKNTHFGISTESNSAGRNYFTQIFIQK
ncbi:CAP domain-containing protein [Lutibacter maritimus]|uniref:Cysteine-rich secretory protein family protein n=1 Tax=Lutibacter maritimus TaxID=593133 RepID=A0A1I6QQQ7_9FLAO|nr:CAP domain-containing protein [Lutibacter maritimus]SFS54709.1 Cysteine-rich secretory protein family protein [Lutibacter maritimus]